MICVLFMHFCILLFKWTELELELLAWPLHKRNDIRNKIIEETIVAYLRYHHIHVKFVINFDAANLIISGQLLQAALVGLDTRLVVNFSYSYLINILL